MEKQAIIAAMEQCGFSSEDIKVAFESQSVSQKELTKNVYVMLWSPTKSSGLLSVLSPTIQKLTHSPYSHSSFGLNSDGVFHSLSNANGVIKTFFDTALAIENLNTLQGLNASEATWNIYKFPITEIEYARAVAIWNEHQSQSFRYSISKLLAIGLRLITGKSPDEFFKGFRNDDIYNNSMICSAFTTSTMCQIAPRIISYIRKENVDIKYIKPNEIPKLPFIKFLFTGNLVFPYDRWKELYEKKFGFLPN